MFGNKEITVSRKIFSKYKTITAAIQNAVPGAKIFVEPGTYHENIIIDKEIELIGNGPVNEIILYSKNTSAILMQTEHAIVRGITIHQGGQSKENEYYYAVDLPMGSLILEDCNISSDIGGGIRVHNLHTNPVIQRCNIHNTQRNGIFITTKGNPTIRDCKIYNNLMNGVYVNNKGRGTIENCEIYSNTYPNVCIKSEGDPVIRGCKIYESKQNGVWVKEKGRGMIENCEIYSNTYPNVDIESEGDPVIRGCKIYKGETNGLVVANKGRGTIENCEIYSNTYPNVCIKSEGDPVIRGCKIYESKQNGVWVKEKGRGMIENCEIYSNTYPNVDIESEGDPVIRGCKIYKGETNGLVVANKGRGTIENCEIYSNTYPNVCIKSEGDPVIRGCKIYESKENGVWVKEKGRGMIENCEIYSNTYPNVDIESEGDPVIRGCKIYESKENGVWVKEKGRGMIENCEIYSNTYPNVDIESEGDPVIRGCKIYKGESNGLVVTKKGRGTIENCEIYSNTYPNVAIESEGDPVIRGCKIYKGETDGVLVKEKGRGMIENCEIYSNTYPNVCIESEGDPVIRGCKIYKGESNGLVVTKKGRGRLENCEIYNAPEDCPAVVIDKEGNPTLQKCKIYDNRGTGVWVKEQGYGVLENCEIYGNFIQDIEISEDSKVVILGSTTKQEERKDEEKKQDNSYHQFSDGNISELNKVLEELDSLIGMENVKKQIRETIEYIQFNQELANFGIESENVKIAASHTVLYGNPGTGKTTVAKLLGKLYKAMGLLSSGHVVEANREKLVGEYIGHTAPKTKKKIDEAMGGILFIDEAYALTNKGSENDFGPEAIEVLLEEMENRKGEFVVVVAGYEKEMAQFLEANPGLKSRFTQYFHLQDYTPDEMVDIARKMVRDKKRKLSQDAEEALHKEFTLLWRKRDRFFSNARTVRNYVDGMLQAQAQRCMRVPREQWTKEFLLTLTAEDVQAVLPKKETKTFDLPINEALLSETLQRLHRMIGMDQVKAEIEKLVTLVRFYKEEGRDLAELSPHTLLVGSPGTGKTEVARIIAKIYEALGILERGDLVEVNRDKLVSAYPGESEKLIARYIDQAMGGTLFIDEAYQLTQYGAHDPGHKVIEVLLKRMEDDRGKFIVIVAGYKEKMEQFLDSNDGLRRRFVRCIEFEDYTPSELMQISELMLQEKGYRLDGEARKSLFAYYESAYENRDHTFGNAGFARNVVNEAIKNIDYRVAKMPKEKRTQEITKTILAEDINPAIKK
ncbi:right-handed parallel beta-helix repeat-containing protein [Geobacillus sp. DSP4a]|uniref:right-handed parallel beta-helix repeat-containing protein n=1 Tax=Geobacillus sp. DSP4a TaxID=2508873 RepID=UPI0014912336|nr:right-handed parallel beta-helix repeat-containing protein [Geobacillus sp. DSP4a]NNU98469.1 AAA family ATPase [Geobacillus sp. DSP4a]